MRDYTEPQCAFANATISNAQYIVPLSPPPSALQIRVRKMRVFFDPSQKTAIDFQKRKLDWLDGKRIKGKNRRGFEALNEVIPVRGVRSLHLGNVTREEINWLWRC